MYASKNVKDIFLSQMRAYEISVLDAHAYQHRC